MKLNAVGITSKDLKRTVTFYELLGFKFPEFSDNEQHLEPLPTEGSVRLMIDTYELVKGLIENEPVPATHSTFALEFDSPSEIDEIVKRLHEAGETVIKQPWDAFWGQRYAIVADPDGYMIDLYAAL